MDRKLVTLLEQIQEGSAEFGDVARFLARHSWQLLDSPVWEDTSVTGELELIVAEIHSGLDTEFSLRSFAQDVLEQTRAPGLIVSLVPVQIDHSSTAVSLGPIRATVAMA